MTGGSECEWLAGDGGGEWHGDETAGPPPGRSEVRELAARGLRACRFACMGWRAQGRGAARARSDAQSVRPTRTGTGPLARRLGDRSHASRKPPVTRARPLARTDVCALTDRKHAGRGRQTHRPRALLAQMYADTRTRPQSSEPAAIIT